MKSTHIQSNEHVTYYLGMTSSSNLLSIEEIKKIIEGREVLAGDPNDITVIARKKMKRTLLFWVMMIAIMKRP